MQFANWNGKPEELEPILREGSAQLEPPESLLKNRTRTGTAPLELRRENPLSQRNRLD